jgi:hypothetical protein
MAVDTANLQAKTSPGPNSSSNSEQLEVHPGWVRSGVDNTPGHKAISILKPSPERPTKWNNSSGTF